MKKNLFKVLSCLLLTIVMLTACASEPESNAAPGMAASAPMPATAAARSAPEAPAAPAAADVMMWAAEAEMGEMLIAFDIDASTALYSAAGAMTVQNTVFAPSPPGETIGAPPILTPSQAGDRMFVYTMHYSLQTTEFMPGVRTLLNMVADHRGYTLRASITGHDLRHTNVERSASFVFRVPSESIPRFIEEMEVRFNLLHWDLSAVEETRTYQENISGIADARDREARLLEELENVTNAAIRRNLENDLRNAQNEIRQRESAIAAIESNVIYSNVTVWLAEVIFEEEEPEEPAPSFGEIVSSTINDSWLALIGALQGILIFVISAFPILLILLAIAIVAWRHYRVIKGHRKEEAGEEKPEKDEKTEE